MIEDSEYMGSSTIVTSSRILIFGCVTISVLLAFPIWKNQFCWKSVNTGLYGASIQTILQDLLTREFLRQIAVEKRMGNVISCWEQIVEFENITASADSEEKMLDKVHEIVEGYIEPGAPFELLGVNFDLRDKLTRESNFCLENDGIPRGLNFIFPFRFCSNLFLYDRRHV